jgi:hypothetical protein
VASKFKVLMVPKKAAGPNAASGTLFPADATMSAI